MLVWLLVMGLAVVVFAGVQVSNGALYFFNETSDLRGSVHLKVFDLARWWDLNYSSVLVRASVGLSRGLSGWREPCLTTPCFGRTVPAATQPRLRLSRTGAPSTRI
jgi:hypothetical protein